VLEELIGDEPTGRSKSEASVGFIGETVGEKNIEIRNPRAAKLEGVNAR
jgi:hypothetical protein